MTGTTWAWCGCSFYGYTYYVERLGSCAWRCTWTERRAFDRAFGLTFAPTPTLRLDALTPPSYPPFPPQVVHLDSEGSVCSAAEAKQRDGITEYGITESTPTLPLPPPYP